MGIRIPRITVAADFGDDRAFGDLSLLSVGYGLHQAWVYATMFGAAPVFGTRDYVTGLYGSSLSFPFIVSIVVYVICLITAGVTNQLFLRLYVSKKTIVAGALLAFTGTLLLFVPETGPFPLFESVSGILTGIGSAIFILFWGTAFARCDSASIVLNTAVAISVSIGVFAFALHYLPFPLSGVLTSVVPLLELAILWRKTPQPFHERDGIPLFKPLPINHGKFLLRFGAPVAAFGLALGMLRQNSLQSVVASAEVGSQLTLLLAAGCATVLILITILALGGGDKWSRYFQPLVPLIAVSVFFIPFSNAEYGQIGSMFLVVGFLCFEALMWIFFGELSQRFRLSPIFVFGTGRGLLAAAMLVGALVPIAASHWAAAFPFGETGLVIVILIAMVIAYALLPREREIEAIVVPCPLVREVAEEHEQRTSHGNAASTGERAEKRAREQVHGAPADVTGELAPVACAPKGAEPDAGASPCSSDAEAGSTAIGEKAEHASQAGTGEAGTAHGRAPFAVAEAAGVRERAAADAGEHKTADATPAETSASSQPASRGNTARLSSPAELSSGTAQSAAAERAAHVDRAAVQPAPSTDATAQPAAADTVHAPDNTTPVPAKATGGKEAGAPLTLADAPADATESATESASDSATPDRTQTHAAPSREAGTRSSRPSSLDAKRGGGRFRAKCETVANTYLLSRRETEILFLLAKGYNSAYIQEKLYISEGTAKTHIRHIYRKTNVHAQQDLMRLVENAEPSR